MDVPVRFIDSIINNPLLMQFLVHRWFFLLEYDPRLDQLRVYDTRSRTLETLDAYLGSEKPEHATIFAEDRWKMRALLTAAFDGLVLGDNPALWLSPVSYTESGYIMDIKVGNLTVTGKEVRAALDLRSASFAISYDSAEDLFTIHTQGYGHGVGLSQYGADYMARQGADFKEILTHYYTGVELAVLD